MRLVAFAGLLLFAGFLMAAVVGLIADAQGSQVVRYERVHLPTTCRPYYNDGTERWINCMGVGYVREEDEEHD